MTFDEIDPEIRICYGAHQAFLRIGFEAEHIFCGINGGRLLVVLRPPKKPEFVLTACETPMTYDDFIMKWIAFIDAMQIAKTINTETCEALYDEFLGLHQSVPLLGALVAKGLLPL